MYVRGSRNGDDFGSQGRNPGEGELCGSYALLVGEGLHGVDYGHVVLEIFLLVKAGEETAEVVF